MKARSELQGKVSNWSQLGGLQRSRLVGGKAEGVEVIDLRSGGGLRIQILAGRGMDVGLAEFRGIPLNWLSPVGVVHPQYFQPRGIEFLNSCGGGLFFTCGLTQVGAPCQDEGEELPMHGFISNTPARDICCRSEWQGDRFLMEATGEVHDVSLLRHHLVLRRTYSCCLGENRVRITDRVRNQGPAVTPHMILYHFNFGYPFLDSGARVILPSQGIEARDQDSRAGMDSWSEVAEPSRGFFEQVFYHRLAADEKGRTCAALLNEALGLAVAIHFDRRQLDQFVQWKSLNDQIYALGLEPANCRVQGRAHDRARGILEFLEPGEERLYELEFEVIEGSDATTKLCQKIQEMTHAQDHVG